MACEHRYLVTSAAQAVTAAADLLHVEAGVDYPVRVEKVWIVPGSQTAAAYHQLILRRTTSASTGGTAITPAPLDANAPAFTGAARSGAAGGGADGTTLLNGSVFVPTATTIRDTPEHVVFDCNGDPKKAIRIAKGGTTGIELRNATGGAGGANHYACALIVEER